MFKGLISARGGVSVQFSAPASLLKGKELRLPTDSEVGWAAEPDRNVLSQPEMERRYRRLVTIPTELSRLPAYPVSSEASGVLFLSCVWWFRTDGVSFHEH